MIAETIKILQSNDFYGETEAIEIAKGKNEYVNNFADAKEKIKRIWLSKKL